MEAWGAPQDEIDQVRARLDQDAQPASEEHFGVYADNWEAVMVFRALGARWQHAGMVGQRTGFDWAGVEAWIDRHIHRRRRRALSADLLTMERAALQADSEQRKQEE